MPHTIKISATWTSVNQTTYSATYECYPHNLYVPQIHNVNEANTWTKSLFGNLSGVVFTEEECVDGIPLEYHISYPAGNHTEYSTLSCSKIINSNGDFKEIITDTIMARCADLELQKILGRSIYYFKFVDTYISTSGTLSSSGRQYWEVWGHNPTPIVVLSDGSMYEGSITTGSSGGGGVACFIEGTKILTKNGLKNIELIKDGDLVISKNIDTGKLEEQKVYQTYNHKPRFLF